MGQDSNRGEKDLHDRGLEADLAAIRAQLRRRALLKLMGGAVALVLVGCGDEGEGASDPTPSPEGTVGLAATPAAVTVTPLPTKATPRSACTDAIPPETAGPFPADGSNGPNVLAQTGIVRHNIRSSFGISSTVAEGVPLTVRLQVVDTANGCRPLANAAVYLWHCDARGRYSVYELPGENYLRGVQPTDGEGWVTFETVFPGCYAGRWPHIHFEVYPDLERATSSANKVLTSQLALPRDVCERVYARGEYGNSARNLASLSLERDTIFRDGWQRQMATVSGDAESGYLATLVVGV
jgi:protocatechuate 3,4-dioxygenase beta subunit